MTTIHRTALVEYSAREMYDLVSDIDSYPQFVPMCDEVEVHKHTDIEAQATLKIKKGGVKIDFATHNDMIEPEQIKIRLLKGPFKRLTGLWKFIPLNEKACKVSLDLEFEFSNRVLALALGVVFNSLANSMLESFCKRADQVYHEVH